MTSVLSESQTWKPLIANPFVVHLAIRQMLKRIVFKHS